MPVNPSGSELLRYNFRRKNKHFIYSWNCVLLVLISLLARGWKRERNVVNFGFCFFGTKVLRHCRCCAACQVCLVVCSAAVVAAASSLAVAYLEALWHCQLRCAGFCGIAFKLIVLHISVATTPAGISHAFKAPQLCSNPFFCSLVVFSAFGLPLIVVLRGDALQLAALDVYRTAKTLQL